MQNFDVFVSLNSKTITSQILIINIDRQKFPQFLDRIVQKKIIIYCKDKI